MLMKLERGNLEMDFFRNSLQNKHGNTLQKTDT